MFNSRVLNILCKCNRKYLKSFVAGYSKNNFSTGSSLHSSTLAACNGLDYSRRFIKYVSVPRHFCNNTPANSFESDYVLSKKSRGRKSKIPIEIQSVFKSDESKTIHYEDSTMKEFKTTFPTPKNVADNIYSLVSTELKSKQHILTPSYKHRKKGVNDSEWTCTLAVKWPEDMKFVAINRVKRTAASDAALTLLLWLKNNGKLSENNQPLIYSQEVVNSIKKDRSKSAILRLNPLAEHKMKQINAVFEAQMKDIVELSMKKSLNEQDVKDNQITEFSHINNSILRQTYRGTNFYLAKESVNLPISEHKEEIISLINDNQVVVVRGEPGCGKSTRVPQYLLEGWAREDGLAAEPCQILVTQPRRIAAISLAERVAKERGERVGDTVGFTVRLHSAHNPRTTRLHYLTTGVLLRRVQSDPTLAHCTHVVLDEAHERDVNTDLLMNLLRQALVINPKLKVIVMSATIDTDVFKKYFEGCRVGVIHIPGFTYPIENTFLEDLDLKGLDLSKTRKMVEGGEGEDVRVIHEDVADVIKGIHKSKPPGAILCFLPGWEDIRKIRDLLPPSRDMFVLCLHSRLQEDEQKKIFGKSPPGIRKVILATNIAETSVTIDDVVYVIDTGICKERTLDLDKGIPCLDNHWISSASARQRRGRAGRCQPGQAYHMYTSTKHASFIPYTLPEILRTSLTKIVLDSKVYSNNMLAVDFLRMLPSPPDEQAVVNAVDELKELQLLDDKECLTPLGRTISEFQLEPKLAKALVNSVVFHCVTPVVDIITLFSAETEIFASSLNIKEAISRIKQTYSDTSDHLALMRIFEKWLGLYEDEDFDKASRYCYNNNLLDYRLVTLSKLRGIHFGYLQNGLHNILNFNDSFSDNDEIVKGVLLSGIGTLLQYRNWNIVKGRMKKTNLLLTRHNHHASISSESVNHKRNHYPSDFLLYINETRSNIKRTTTIRETSFLSPLTVLIFNSKKLIIEDISESEFSSELESTDQVLIGLESTKLKLLCDRAEASLLVQCKESLLSVYQYYISQLTYGNEKSDKMNDGWQKMLHHLSDVLISIDSKSQKTKRSAK